jgi:hypothetical protein
MQLQRRQSRPYIAVLRLHIPGLCRFLYVCGIVNTGPHSLSVSLSNFRQTGLDRKCRDRCRKSRYPQSMISAWHTQIVPLSNSCQSKPARAVRPRPSAHIPTCALRHPIRTCAFRHPYEHAPFGAHTNNKVYVSITLAVCMEDVRTSF